MATPKFKWKVEEAPTGPYRSFHVRGWPSALYKNERQDLCCVIQCKDDYTPFRAKSGQHAPLFVRICDYSVKPSGWIVLGDRYVTLVAAKAALAACLEGNPGVMPAEFHKTADAVKN